jgi:hydrogenase/urease accessory protein HupE
MNSFVASILAVLTWFISVEAASCHEEPTSHIEIHFDPQQITASLTASALDLAHDLEQVEPAMLMRADVLQRYQQSLAEIAFSRIQWQADGIPMQATLASATAIPDRQDIRFDFNLTPLAVPREVQVSCQLFPYDPRHRTYLNCYMGEILRHQVVFEGTVTSHTILLASEQSLGAVVREFTAEGIHHIFIGPDHILFMIGLVLLGGNLRKLLLIATAFTLAHTITLCLATFRILNPPPSVVEPVIALSVVIVGLHALLGKRLGDPRLLFAFGFGLIHGFGFASVLQEMELPPQALGWSLVSFNVGVELGQASIILAVAPMLAGLRKCRPLLAQRVTSGMALSVITAGAFWFFQRIF